MQNAIQVARQDHAEIVEGDVADKILQCKQPSIVPFFPRRVDWLYVINLLPKIVRGRCDFGTRRNAIKDPF